MPSYAPSVLWFAKKQEQLSKYLDRGHTIQLDNFVPNTDIKLLEITKFH
jgi:hypothetical protein